MRTCRMGELTAREVMSPRAVAFHETLDPASQNLTAPCCRGASGNTDVVGSLHAASSTAAPTRTECEPAGENLVVMRVSSFGCARKLMTGTHVPVRLVSGLTQTLVDWGHGGRACDLFSPEANGSGDPSFCARTSPEPEAMTDARVAVSHSAVSKALRRLEERLGVPLVRRTTRSVHLTEAGERLYASVRRRWTREPVSPRGGGNATDRAIRAQPAWRPTIDITGGFEAGVRRSRVST